MSNKTYFALIVIIILIVASIAAYYRFSPSEGPNSTETVTGLNVGDIFIYEMTGYAEPYIGSDKPADFYVPKNFVDVNSTKYYRIEITKVEPPIISFVATWEFKNGTSISYDYMVNINDGSFNGGEDRFGSSECYRAIYAAGLTAGSLSRPASPDEEIINETRIESFNNVNREINYLRTEFEAYDYDDKTYSTLCHVYLYIQFDKQMGIMTNYRSIQVYSADAIILTIDYKIVDSNTGPFHTGTFLR